MDGGGHQGLGQAAADELKHRHLSSRVLHSHTVCTRRTQQMQDTHRHGAAPTAAGSGVSALKCDMRQPLQLRNASAPAGASAQDSSTLRTQPYNPRTAAGQLADPHPANSDEQPSREHRHTDTQTPPPQTHTHTQNHPPPTHTHAPNAPQTHTPHTDPPPNTPTQHTHPSHAHPPGLSLR